MPSTLCPLPYPLFTFAYWAMTGLSTVPWLACRWHTRRCRRCQVGAEVNFSTLVFAGMGAPKSWSLSNIFSLRKWRAKEEEEDEKASTKASISADNGISAEDGIDCASESNGTGRSAETIASSNQEQALQQNCASPDRCADFHHPVRHANAYSKQSASVMLSSKNTTPTKMIPLCLSHAPFVSGPAIMPPNLETPSSMPRGSWIATLPYMPDDPLAWSATTHLKTRS
jgi:hypothetical protein